MRAARGWYFGWQVRLRPDRLLTTPVGCNGIIIDKVSAEVFALGSAFPFERDLHFYDRGFRSEVYDLVILAVHDMARAIESIKRIGPTVVVPEFESGTVWRIPRPLDRGQLRNLLQTTPCVFEDLRMYHRLEELERAEREGWHDYRAIGRSPKRS